MAIIWNFLFFPSAIFFLKCLLFDAAGKFTQAKSIHDYAPL